MPYHNLAKTNFIQLYIRNASNCNLKIIKNYNTNCHAEFFAYLLAP